MRVRITQSKKSSSDEGECAEASMRKMGKLLAEKRHILYNRHSSNMGSPSKSISQEG
jgi:hypothetical protein